MNKLLFSEGGQPFYIDDIRLLQDNLFCFQATLLKLFMGEQDVCLLSKCDVQTLGLTGTLARRVKVPAGHLVVGGLIVPFAETTIEVPQGETVNVCLRRSESDIRVFEDGQERACSEIFMAYVSTTGTGASQSYDISSLPTLMDLLADKLERSGTIGGTELNFCNGYTGKMKVRNLADDWEFSIDICTSRSDWDSSALGYKGLLFSIQDESVAGLLAGRKSPSFSYNGQSFFLAFGTTSPCFLWPDGVDNIYEDSVKIPLIPISLTFRLSQTTVDY